MPVLLVKIGTSNAVKCPIIEVTNAAESDCNGVYQVSNISVKLAAEKQAFYRIWPKYQPGVRDDRYIEFNKNISDHMTNGHSHLHISADICTGKNHLGSGSLLLTASLSAVLRT